MALKGIGFRGDFLFLARQWPDLLFLISFIFVALMRFERIESVSIRSGISIWMMLFVIYSVLLSASIGANNNAIAFSEIFILLRFTALYGFIVILSPSTTQIHFSISLILLSSMFQFIVGLMQFAGGEEVFQFFKPLDYNSVFSNIERSFTSNREGDRQMIIGSVGDFISFAYVIAIGMFIAIASDISRVKRVTVFFAFFALLFYSGSRTVFLGSFFSILYFYILTNSIDKKVISIIVVATVGIIGFVVMGSLSESVEYRYSSFLAIFSPQIIENLLNQRLGTLIYITPNYILSGDFLIGMSPDRFYLAEYVEQRYVGVPWILNAVLTNVVEDFYLLTLFLYYGLTGFLLLLVIFIVLWRMCWKVYRYFDRFVGALGILMLLGAGVFNIANQALEVRMFAVFFWMIMGFNCVILREKRKSVANTFSAQ